MKKLLIGSGVLLILTYIVIGFNMLSIAATISTGLFCARKVGHYCKLNNLIVIEGLGAFMCLMIQLVFSNFNAIKFIIVLILRVVFIIVCYREITGYVYVKEIRRKE